MQATFWSQAHARVEKGTRITTYNCHLQRFTEFTDIQLWHCQMVCCCTIGFQWSPTITNHHQAQEYMAAVYLAGDITLLTFNELYALRVEHLGAMSPKTLQVCL